MEKREYYQRKEQCEKRDVGELFLGYVVGVWDIGSCVNEVGGVDRYLITEGFREYIVFGYQWIGVIENFNILSVEIK